MTFDPSYSANDRRSNFDSGPLSWVMDEIREALNQSRTSLMNAIAKDGEAGSTLINHAGAFLHQAHGALQIVDVDGASIITEAVEDILRLVVSGDIPLKRATVRTVEQAYQALIEYLEELLSGESPQPMRLYPYYKELQELRKAERIHPADLFFPNLDLLPQHAPAESTVSTAFQVDIARLRARFEKALLALLTASDPPASNPALVELLNVVVDIEHAQTAHKSRDFWWVMHGFIECVVHDDEPVPLFVKQVCGRMNRQIKLLAQGTSSVSDRLLLDALYCIALDRKGTDLTRQIQQAYRLADQIPTDYETKRYGLIDSVSLGLAKSALAQAKNTWHRVTKNEAGADQAFAILLRQMQNLSGRLNSQPLSRLLAAIETASTASPKPSENSSLSLEIATDLLFIENALDHLNRLAEDFPHRVDALVERINAILQGETPPESAPWLDELTQQSQQRQTAAVLSAEMETGLRQVEQIIGAFMSDRTTHATLAQVDPILHQIAGVLSILGQEHAMLAVQHTQSTIRRYIDAVDKAGENASGVEFPDSVTQNIIALGFFVEVLPQHPESARTRFVFDREQGILHANLLERGVPRPAALTTADPSFDPLLDVEEGKPLPVKSSAPPVGVAPIVAEPVESLPSTAEEIDAELLEIFMSEAEDVLAFVRASVPEARMHASDQNQLSTLRRSFHTLKGSGRMVGLSAFSEAAYSIEKVMNQWLADSRSGTEELFALLDVSAEELSQWVADLRASGRSSRSPDALAVAAARVQAGLSHDFDQQAGVTVPSSLADEAPHVPASSVGSAETVVHSLQDVPPASNVVEFPLASVPQVLDDTLKCIGHLEISLPLFNIFVAEADDYLRFLTQDFSEWRHEPARAVNPRAIHAAHSLAGSSATVGLSPVQEVAHALEIFLQTLEQQPSPLSPADFDLLQAAIAQLKVMMQQFALGDLPGDQPDLILSIRALQQTTAMPAAGAPTMVEQDPFITRRVTMEAEAATLPVHDDQQDDEMEADATLHDHLDADLLPVFLDEGRDLLPQIGQSLRTWHQSPGNAEVVPEILRNLHTAKGSARMAGAMILGENLHHMETQIEHILQSGSPSQSLLDDLMARHDYSMQLFDHLQNPGTEKPVPVTSLLPDPPPPVSTPSERSALTQSSSGSTQAPLTAPQNAPVARVRVRADVLDRLVNQAGEVSIARSKIENEVDTLRQSLTDLTENLSRLRGQLREVEIQAESQIASRAQAADREFDPLEFDRFSRLQELTRMMTESVDDVASIQDSLMRTVSGATTDLEAQALLTRSLQQDLMQVRMVPFASISERLYQITRQTSKEMGKSVSLDIRGTSVEVDRNVLEKMVGPLEHLLRNAIVHGIEERAERRSAAKNESGELLVEIRQAGNEVVIELSDDGRGLDLQRIRARAVDAGLIPLDRDLTESEIVNLIFQTGFSTASQITALAGRGVGLDVVRAEAASLGGRVNVQSEFGKGTRFTINLPLTLAVTSVVLLSAGNSIYAIPSVLVEQVLQMRNSALVEAYNEGAVKWQGASVPIYFLSAILGDATATPIAQQFTPVLILRSGNERVALHVDEVTGNREVVVKNIGPQLARMIGIVGATVLGSGNIVLILDPVPLAQRAAREYLPRLPMPPAPDPLGNALTAEMLSDKNSSPDESVQGLRKKNIVMVVDDSLTVRRVTQRFLQREGYQVVLAKDGVDALEKLQEVKPDIMLVDIEMPRMDGFDLIRNVRSDSRISKTPIIMITSRTASKHRNYAMELGANEYYGKPFQEQQLLDTIEEFVGEKDGE